MSPKHRQIRKTSRLLSLPDELKNVIFLDCIREDIEKDWHTGSPFYTSEGLTKDSSNPRTYKRRKPNPPTCKRRKPNLPTCKRRNPHKHALLYVCKETSSLYLGLLWLYFPLSFECDARSLLLRSPSFPWDAPSEMFRKLRHCRLFIGLNADEETRKRSISDCDEIKEIPQQMGSLVKRFEKLAKLEITLIDRLWEGCYCPGNEVPVDILDSMVWIKELHTATHATITLSEAFGEIVEVISYKWIKKGKEWHGETLTHNLRLLSKHTRQAPN